MSNLEIHKMLVLSTAHVSERTAEMLDADWIEGRFVRLYAFKRAEGWIFHVPEDASDDNPKMPQDLRAAVAFARAQGCAFLMMDADGPTVDGLTVFEW